MRRIISFLLICTALAANARQVTPEEAQSIASEFFNSGATSKVKKVPRRAVQASRSAEDQSVPQPYYIFNADDNAGFVIISGDTRAKKIIGYSESGSFDTDNMPPQLKALLEQFSKAMETLSASQLEDESWKSNAALTSEEGVLLETANWGQGYPYNAQCPIIDGVQAPTGCVATAMAIVMKYHNWPERYDWNNMPMLTEDFSDANTIGKLMSDIGRSVEMNYGADESSSNSEQVRYSLVEDFGYSNAINQLFLKYLDFELLSSNECFQIITEQILKNQPCLFSGNSDNDSGHMFVCDGVKDDLIHINWGWGGTFNGYYTLSVTTDGKMVYTNNQLLYSEIKRDEKNLSRVFIDTSVNYDRRTGYGLNVRNKNIVAKERIQFVVSSLGAPLDYNGDITLALIDKKGTIKEILSGTDSPIYRIDDDERLRCSYTQKFHRFYWDSRWRNYYFEHTPSEGDYVAVVAREDGSDQWLIVPGTITSTNKVPAIGNKPMMIHLNIINEDGARILMDESSPGVNCVLDEDNNILVGQVFGISANSKDGFPYIDFNGYQSLFICRSGLKTPDTNEISVGANLSAFGTDEIQITIKVDKFDELTRATIHLDEYNTLSDRVSNLDLTKIGDLTISGKLSNNDAGFIAANFPNLMNLNIEDTDLQTISELPTWLKDVTTQLSASGCKLQVISSLI